MSILLEYFEVSNSKFNAYTVKIVRCIVGQKEIKLEELVKADLIKKINDIMSSVMSQHQEWCTDHLLEIMNEILHKAANLKQEQPDNARPQEIYDKLLSNFSAFIKLLSA